jgi:mono/diheme cytochrome c family protein
MRSNPHNILILGAVTLLNGLATEQTIDFQRAISPLLSDNCYSCHGPDSENREAELRLDIQSAAHESPIVPGDPKMSEFIARITNTDPEEQMPPPDSEKTLKPTDIELMRRWVSEGANHEKHWSFEPPHHHDPPQPSKTNLETNPIDAFVLDTLENTSPTASKAVNTAEPTSKAKS